MSLHLAQINCIYLTDGCIVDKSLFARGAVPLVAETVAVLGLMSWVWVDEHGLGPLRDPETGLLKCVHGEQQEEQHCCAHVHLCSEAE